MEQSQVIRELSNNILDLIGKLEGVEGNKDARPKTQEESLEAYMQSSEEENLDRWIELLEEDGYPSDYLSPPSF